jgi:branched-chain amino acid transport system ATP-binding protein
MSVLAVRSVSKWFGGLPALSNVSFEVAEGEILGIIGANGAGKTTLFSLIAGNEQPSAGEIRFQDRPITRHRPDRRCRAGIARTFQIVRPFTALTVIENVMVPVFFGARPERSHDAARARALDILGEVGLRDRHDELAGALTLSDQKRLEIARALGSEPKLIMLDEVMAGLTATEVDELLQAIRAIKQRRSLTVLFVEHVMQAVMRLAGRVIVLHHGEIIAEGSPQTISQHPRVIEVYLGAEVERAAP